MPDQPAGAIRTFRGDFRNAVLSPDGTLLYAAERHALLTFDLVSGWVYGRTDVSHPEFGSNFTTIDMSPDGRYVMAINNSANFENRGAGFFILDTVAGFGGRWIFKIEGQVTGEFLDIVALPNGTALISQSGGGGLLQFDPVKNALTPLGISIPSATLIPSPDHDQILIVEDSPARSIYIYEPGVGITVSHSGFERPDAIASPAAISPSGEDIVQSSSAVLLNGSLMAQRILLSKLPAASPDGMVFSSDGSRFYLSQNEKIFVFETENWKPIAVYALERQLQSEQLYPGENISLSANGRFLAFLTASGVAVIDLDLARPAATDGDDWISDGLTLIGLAGEDTLVGGSYMQSLYGGEGDDTYRIANTAAAIFEFDGEGHDRVETKVSFTLPNFVEDIAFTGFGNATVAGNSLANRIVGGRGNEVLFGAAGDDEIDGGAGDDDIDGGIGRDTAFFADAFEDCTVSYEGQVVVVTTKTQGTDRLRNVETLTFAGIAKDVSIPPDVTPPTVSITSDGPDIATGAFSFRLTFSEDVTGFDSSDVTLSRGSIGAITGDGRVWTVSVEPPARLEGTITLTLRDGAVTDTAGFSSLAASGTKAVDLVAPVLLSVSPGNHAEGIAVDSNIVLRYSEAVFPDTGLIGLYRQRDDTLVELFNVRTSSRIAISGSTVTLDPTREFAYGERYYLFAISGTLFEDAAGLPAPELARGIISFSTLPPASSTLLASDGLGFSVEGDVAIVGTRGFQDVKLGDSGAFVLDPSFNAGGDVVRLPEVASNYEIRLEGSSAIMRGIYGEDFEVVMPVGIVGMLVAFADGVRELVYEPVGKAAYIGEQALKSGYEVITAPSAGVVAPHGADSSSRGVVQLSEDANLHLGGNLDVIGTAHDETIHVSHGHVTFDPSFNRGGDAIQLDKLFRSFTFERSGSSVTMSSGELVLVLPVGTFGMTIDFAGDQRTLIYDLPSVQVMLGDEIIPAGVSAFG